MAATYDKIAPEYATRFDDELTGKPFDRDLLDRFAGRVGPEGVVLDLGAGPGHVGASISGRVGAVVAADLSFNMLAEAKRLHPELRRQLADMRHLPFAEGSFDGVLCFYSLIHVRRDEVEGTLRELVRVVRPGGVVVLAVHRGRGTLHVDEFLGKAVPSDATLFEGDELTSFAVGAGLVVREVTSRAPYDTESQNPHLHGRIYVWAERPFTPEPARP